MARRAAGGPLAGDSPGVARCQGQFGEVPLPGLWGLPGDAEAPTVPPWDLEVVRPSLVVTHIHPGEPRLERTRPVPSLRGSLGSPVCSRV